MSKKVRVIEGSNKKPDSKTQVARKVITTVGEKDVKQRNPALAYSLSLLIWGGGQFYNRQWKFGIVFLTLMILFYLFMSINIIFWEPITTFFKSFYVNSSETLLICGFFYISGLMIWHFSALQAYVRALKINPLSFKGIGSTVLPVVCSLLMPGWGQFLNGQTKKGLFYQMFTLAGFAIFPAIIVIFLMWPSLEASRARLILEWISTLCIIFTPFILIIWLFSVFDAGKTCKDENIKEPLPKRITYAINRFNSKIKLHGWKNVVLLFGKRIVFVMVLLIFCAISYHYIPKNYYIQQLQNLENRTSKNEMTVIPKLIKKLLNNISIES
ncbi:MAG: hypothetical protein KAJ34_04020 [Thermodesulfovibrionia bacterium]|nr:hypothetical protein [Thermodesulfovibrionia bacterium]